MNVKRFIHWHPNDPKEGDKLLASVHLLVGYNQATLADFLEMADLLRETFPDVKNENLFCERVTRSAWFANYSLIHVNMYLKPGEYPGWEQNHTGRIEYRWQ